MSSWLSFSPTTTFLFRTSFSGGIDFLFNALEKILMNSYTKNLIVNKFSSRTVQSFNHGVVFCSFMTWFFFGNKLDFDENLQNGLC